MLMSHAGKTDRKTWSGAVEASRLVRAFRSMKAVENRWRSWTCRARGLAAFVAAWLAPSYAAAQLGGASPAPVAGGSGAFAYWQAPAVPQAVVQGGGIPAGWQPQAVPYHGIGPDGRPLTVYVAPTYVFTFQSGPPVLAIPGGGRGAARLVPASSIVGSGTPAPTVARYAPAPYQFPGDSRALSGTPVMPPEGSPTPAAPAVQPPPPPTAWASASAPEPPSAPPVVVPPPAPSSGDWVTVVPPAVASAALAAGATTASQADASPVASAAGPTPAQQVSTGGLTAAASPVSAPHLWRVVGVQDGDTVTCLDESNQQQRIRLAEIDAPELGQDYGKEAREALAALVFGKTVEVYDQGRDAEGRWIARLVVDGVDVDRQMVATGNAWQYTAFSSNQDLAAMQTQAQAQKSGLWGGSTAPTPPWVYRQAAGGS